MQNPLTFPLFSLKNNGSSQRFRRWNDPNSNHTTDMAQAANPIPQLTASDKLRFWSRISNHETLSGCQEWIAGKFADGYGGFRIGKRTYKSSRIAYFLETGVDPGELCVCHRCDNRKCVNPDCLFLGSPKENVQDMLRKGRANKAVGEDQGASKLTAADIPLIRSDHRMLKEIAKLYGVALMTISKIKRGQTWKHVPLDNNQSPQAGASPQLI